jgi:hypothetical protein
MAYNQVKEEVCVTTKLPPVISEIISQYVNFHICTVVHMFAEYPQHFIKKPCHLLYKQMANGKNDKCVKYSKYNVIIYINDDVMYEGPSKKQLIDMVKTRSETFHNNILCPVIYRCERVFGWYSLIELNSDDINTVPSKYVTPKKCEHAFNCRHSNIKYIPKNCMTQKMCQTAFDIDIYYFRYFSKKYITQEMCDEIVRFYPHYILEEIPIRFITDSMCSHIVEDKDELHGYRYVRKIKNIT